MDLSTIIYTYRKEHGMSLRAFADKAGLSHTYISLLERGRSSKAEIPMSPSLEHLEKIAKGLGITLQDLLALMTDGTPDDIPQADDISKIKKDFIDSVKDLDDDSVRRLQQLVDLIKR